MQNGEKHIMKKCVICLKKVILGDVHLKENAVNVIIVLNLNKVNFLFNQLLISNIKIKINKC